MDYMKGKNYFFSVSNLFIIIEYMKIIYVYFDPPGIK